MRCGPAEAVAIIVERLGPRRPGAAATAWIGIDGFGASGKTTFAAQLHAAVPDSVVVHVDDFAGPQVTEWDWARFERQVLLPLSAGSAGRYQRWDWDLDLGAEWHEVPVGAVVIVEGVSSTRSELAVAWTFTVWLDAPRGLRVRRALERDGAERMQLWFERWMPSEQAYAAREDPVGRVDLVIAGDGG